MRKMKKINGYLVVKFNARELREYEGTALGEYGVIDAELYTGNLDVDRGAMEYDNAGSLDADGAPALALRKALRERVGELAEMMEDNYAVEQYRKGGGAK